MYNLRPISAGDWVQQTCCPALIHVRYYEHYKEPQFHCRGQLGRLVGYSKSQYVSYEGIAQQQAIILDGKAIGIGGHCIIAANAWNSLIDSSQVHYVHCLL